MKNRFVSFFELLEYFVKDNLKTDIASCLVIGISSVSDFLYIAENQKKDVKSQLNINRRYDSFEANPKALGQIFIAELDKDQLEAALFNERYDITELWEKAANAIIQPRHSITYLALRNTTYTWWDENVFEEMEFEYNLY